MRTGVRVIGGVSRYKQWQARITNTALRGQIAISNIDMYVQRRQMAWLGRMSQMETCEDTTADDGLPGVQKETNSSTEEATRKEGRVAVGQVSQSQLVHRSGIHLGQRNIPDSEKISVSKWIICMK
jgi:hypothetical protein